MTLLRDIQEGATGDTSLSALLRKTMVLAARLDHAELKTWVDSELNGYPSADELPPYRRGGQVPVVGGFRGPGNSGGDQPIPPAVVADEELRADLFSWHYTQGVAAYEDLLGRNEMTFEFSWPQDAVTIFQEIMPGFLMISARRVVSSAEIRQVLDAIRNKLLTFALEIERQAPDAGEAPVGHPALAADEVSQTMHITIYGGTNTFATAGRDAHAEGPSGPGPGFPALSDELRAIGLAYDDISALSEALSIDRANNTEDSKVGAAVKGWLGDMAVKTADKSTDIGAATITAMVLKALGAG